MLNRWTTILIRGRWAFALLWAAMIVIGALKLPDLEFSFNLGRMLRGDDARLAEVRDFYSTFPPSDGHVMVTATADETLTIDQLRAAARWADSIQELPQVNEVLSPDLLLNLKLDGFTLDEWARLGGDGSENIKLGDGPGMATFKGNIVSRDLKSVALYIIKKGGVPRHRLHNALESNLDPPWPGAEIRIVGADYVLQKMGGLLKSNFYSLIRFEVIALALVIPLFMRSLRRAYLPMLMAFSALIAYGAIFILSGQDFGVLHLAGPGLILVIALADAIHLQQKFDDARAQGLDIRQSLNDMFRTVGRACFLTSLTTACGFLSLVVARQQEVYDFGIWCAIGVGTAFATVLLFLPVALVFFPGDGKPHVLRSWIEPQTLRRFAAPVTVLIVILAAGVFKTKFDTSLDQELPLDVPAVKDANWFAENFRGIDRIEVDLHANLRDRNVFALVEEMQNDLRNFTGISGSRSYVDAVQMTLAPDVVETKDGPMLGVQALSSGGAFPVHLLNRDLNRACIVFYRTRDFGTHAYELFRDRIREYEKRLPPGSSLKLNGYFPMFYDSTTLISKTLVTSLIVSLSMITLILVFVLRSVRLALLCLIPNAIPLLVVAGVSGWLGASIHLGILVVFSIGLGLAVDDTIHLMVRFKQLQKANPKGNLRTLIDEAVVSSGFAIVLTSIVLLVAATCFLGSNFTTMRWTGLTLGIVAITALLADLTVLPWLIEKFERPKKKKLQPATTP
ncbi:MAG: MMPL family transporter [Verrucomicrobiota bacterium]